MAGIALFSAVVHFQLINLPVEFDARARRALLATGLIRSEEDEVVARVLNVAARSYVAAPLTSILTPSFFLFRSGLLSGKHGEQPGESSPRCFPSALLRLFDQLVQCGVDGLRAGRADPLVPDDPFRVDDVERRRCG
jgi:hypothetical protein